MAAPDNVYSTTTWEDQYGCFNQLLNHGNFDATSGWSNYTSKAPYSIDTTTGECVMTVNTAVRNPCVTRTIPTIASGHVVFISMWLKIESETNVNFRTGFIYSPSQYWTTALNSDDYSEWTHIVGTINCTSDKTRIYIGAYGTSSTQKFPVGSKIHLKNCWMTDLTAMYGAGFEPTAAVFSSHYSKAYYAYKTVPDNPTNTQIYCKLPLQKTAYVNDNTFKSTFYCDHILPVVDADGHNCVLGMVIPGSDNYNRHNENKISKLSVRWHGNNYNILWDGGLNTKPQAMLNSTVASTAVPIQYANYIKIGAHLKSAYYVDDNRFRADIYKVSGDTETYVDGGYFMPTSQQIDYPAQFAQNGVYTILQPSVGITAGDTVRVKTTGINEEGEYTHTRTVDFTALAPVNFTQVYRFTFSSPPPPSTTNPITGVKYLMAIDSSRYAANGTFTRLFALPSGDWLDLGSDQTEWLKGIVGEEGAQAGAGNPANLATGYYYGVPTTWQGSTLRYVQIANGASGSSTRRLAWYPNNYTTTNYNITISLSGIHYTLTNTYTITVTAHLSGTWSGNVNVSCPIYWIRRNTYTSSGITVSGSGSSSTFVVGTFNITQANVDTYDGLRTGDASSVTTSTTPAAANTTEGSMLMGQIQDDNV